jgi:AcrR family transcriptional regulator
MTDKKTTKRNLIIETAAKLWQETHNVSKVSLADVAQVAGVSPTTVYNIFKNREGLVREVIKYLVRNTIKRQWEVIKSGLPIPLKIQSMINVKTTSMAGMQTDVLTKLAKDPVTKRYLNEVFKNEVMPMMEQVVSEGKQQGYIDKDLPVEAIVLYFDIIKEGGLACAEELGEVMNNPRLMAGLTRIFYYGLFQKEFELNIDFNTVRRADE